MTLFSKKFVPQIVIVLAAMPWLLGSTCGGTPIVAFSGVVPQAAIDLNGTYTIAVVSGDTSQLPSNPTLVIAGGLLTRLGDINLTPTNVSNTGNNYIWAGAANIAYSPTFSAVTTVTLNLDLQPNKTLLGTIVVSAAGQTSNPLNISLTKQ